MRARAGWDAELRGILAEGKAVNDANNSTSLQIAEANTLEREPGAMMGIRKPEPLRVVDPIIIGASPVRHAASPMASEFVLLSIPGGQELTT